MRFFFPFVCFLSVLRAIWYFAVYLSRIFIGFYMRKRHTNIADSAKKKIRSHANVLRNGCIQIKRKWWRFRCDRVYILRVTPINVEFFGMEPISAAVLEYMISTTRKEIQRHQKNAHTPLFHYRFLCYLFILLFYKLQQFNCFVSWARSTVSNRIPFGAVIFFHSYRTQMRSQ